MSRRTRRTLRKKHQATLDQYTRNLTKISEKDYEGKTGKPFPKDVVECYVSQSFFVQVHRENLMLRISVNRNRLSNAGGWEQNITWEELQDIKNTIGFNECDCVEIYPREFDEVNASNMRHLWVMPEALSFAWRNKVNIVSQSLIEGE